MMQDPGPEGWKIFDELSKRSKQPMPSQPRVQNPVTFTGTAGGLGLGGNTGPFKPNVIAGGYRPNLPMPKVMSEPRKQVEFTKNIPPPWTSGMFKPPGNMETIPSFSMGNKPQIDWNQRFGFGPSMPGPVGGNWNQGNVGNIQELLRMLFGNRV